VTFRNRFVSTTHARGNAVGSSMPGDALPDGGPADEEGSALARADAASGPIDREERFQRRA
jgi:hypothetical protein